MRKIISIMVIVMITIMITPETFAGSNRAVINVQARILPVVKQTVLYREGSLVITDADIKKGYVEVNRGIVLSIKTNATNGYIAGFFVGSGLFNEVAVIDGGTVYRLSGSGGEVHMPYPGLNPITKEISFRFRLSPEAKPGLYPWPVTVTATAM